MGIRNIKLRKMLKDEKAPYELQEVNVIGFIKEDYALDKTKKLNIISKLAYKINPKRKSNLQIAIEEIKKNPIIIEILLNNKELCDNDNLQKIFDNYIKLLNSNKTYNEDLLEYAKGFDDIMDEKNFMALYPILEEDLRKSISEFEKNKDNFINKNFKNNQVENYNKALDGDLDKCCFLYRYEDFKIDESQRKVNNKINTFLSTVNSVYSKNNESNDCIDEMSKKINCNLEMIAKNYHSGIYLWEIFMANNHNNPKPEDVVKFYELIIKNKLSIIEISIDSYLANSGMNNQFDEINRNLIPKLSWSIDEYKEFLLLCQNKKIDLPLAFEVIKEKKSNNPELDDLFNNFLVNNKSEFIEWLLAKEDSTLYFTNKIRRNNVRQGYSKDVVESYNAIVDELIERQPEKHLRYIDIKYCGSGSCSNVYNIGDYVIKSGNYRSTMNIPNHRRILQPIIRMKVDKSIIEVADAVEVGGPKKMVFEIFEEMLKDGIVWFDANSKNIGKLKRKNVPRHTIQRKVKTENGEKYIDDESSSSEINTNIYGNIEGEPLEAGEYVILDTDFIFDIRTQKGRDKLIGKPIQSYMDKEMIKKIDDRMEEIIQEEKTRCVQKDERDLEQER